MNIKVKGLNEYATAVCNKKFNNSGYIIHGNIVRLAVTICFFIHLTKPF